MKKQYNYGDCIPVGLTVYNRLKRKGYNPIIVEGWVGIVDNPDLLPDEDFLEIFYPEEMKLLENNYYDDYPRVSQHTWIVCGNHIIDITKNQFDYCGGIAGYFEKCRFYFKGNKKTITVEDITIENNLVFL